jgi:hypothetical protein
VDRTPLKSSFLYLADAVNDLRGNWAILAVVLAPMVLAAALCLLPDALNIQSHLAATFEPGTQTIGYHTAQTPYNPEGREAAAQAQQPYPPWITNTLHVLSALITAMATLLVLCVLERTGRGLPSVPIVGETIEIYRHAIGLTPAFLWVSFLQLLTPGIAILLFQNAGAYLPDNLYAAVYLLLAAMLVLGAVVYLWLYFAQYALIFHGQHSFHALLFSRDLMRKRFFKTATRIVVFLAVWSGYNSWAAGAFVVVSLMAGPLGAATNTLVATIFLIDFAAIAVSFATTAFFVAAGLRLYRDLLPGAGAEVERAISAQRSAMQPTAPLGGLSA